MLDAQGQVLLNLRQKSEAAAVLEESAELPGAGPLVFFLLATGQYRQGNLTAARAALNRARAMGLSRNGLMPTDRQALVDLEQALGTN